MLVATHRRRDVLAETLEAIARIDLEGLGPEVVVVENGPPDGAEEVARAASARMPVRYLHEPVANKNLALNRALDAGGLGAIVVFTDDDVVPARGWLRGVADACRRFPDRSVFGGRVEVLWPPGPVPGWARDDPYVRGFAFGHHDLGPVPAEYEGGLLPYGPNWWTRRARIDDGWRFDAAFGPRAGRWVSGSETELLFRLAAAGHPPLFVPDAVVGHRVRPEQITPRWVRGRALAEGAGRAWLDRVPRAAFRRRHPRLWRLEQGGRVARAALAYLGTRLRGRTDAAVSASVRAARRLGAERERLRLPPGGEAPR